MNLLRIASRVFAPFPALLLCFGIAGMSTESAAKSAPNTFPCVSEADLEKSIVPEAALEEFTCFMKNWGGAETLHFKVSIRNVSDTPQRYRVNIFLDNGKAVGGWIPRKTKKGLVQPGQTGGFVYPVGGMPDKPKAIILKITTASP